MTEQKKQSIKTDCLACEYRNMGLYFTDPGPCLVCGGKYKRGGQVEKTQLENGDQHFQNLRKELLDDEK